MIRRHVFIATPLHSGDPAGEYAASLIRTAAALLQGGIAYTHSFLIGNALIHDARNRLVSQALAIPTVTDILFIDGDIAWEPESVLRLLSCPHDVVGGAYPQKRDDLTFNVSIRDVSVSGDLLVVDYLGAGFLRIGRKAVEKLIRLRPECRYADPFGQETHGLFQAPIENGRITGEDAFFCRRWREAGGKVFLDPDITLHHIGRKAWSANFAELMARAPVEAV